MPVTNYFLPAVSTLADDTRIDLLGGAKLACPASLYPICVQSEAVGRVAGWQLSLVLSIMIANVLLNGTWLIA